MGKLPAHNYPKKSGWRQRLTHNGRRLGEGGGLTKPDTKVQLFLSPQNCRDVTPPLLPNRSLCGGHLKPKRAAAATLKVLFRDSSRL